MENPSWLSITREEEGRETERCSGQAAALGVDKKARRPVYCLSWAGVPVVLFPNSE